MLDRLQYRVIDFSGLNTAQHQAVFSNSKELLVLAGAGTGKTRVITFRIARLVKDGVIPSQLLAVTFTNKAAKEMRERLAEMLGEETVATLTVSTFHSFCARLLRKEGHRVGLGKRFSILDSSEQLAQMTRVMKGSGIDPKTIKPRALLTHISWWKNQGISSQQTEKIEFRFEREQAALAERVAKDIYPKYQAHLLSLIHI